MNKLISENLRDVLLSLGNKSTDLVVISGYVGPSVISDFSEKYRNVYVVYGMYGFEGINTNLHSTLLKLNEKNNIEIRYSLSGTHSKAYFIIQNRKIQKVFIGSANFSPNGMDRDIYQEILIELDNFDEQIFIDYIKTIYDNANNCKNIVLNIKNKKTNREKTRNPLSATMPLYLVDKNSMKKYVPLKSGLNWGNQSGNVKKEENGGMESYIKISAGHIDNYPLLFPPLSISRKNDDGKSTRKNDTIDIIWDDGVVMTCLLSGKGAKRNNRFYPKQITSTGEGGNSTLGEYLRKRMNLPERHVITYTDLQTYGRDNIELTYIQEGVYSADFSTKKK